MAAVAHHSADWPKLLGGRWVPGVSGHPERCLATFQPAEGTQDHPVWAGLAHDELGASVTVYDERYIDLHLEPGTQSLMRHETNETWQVMGWAAANGRVHYDGLGHDARSYASPQRVRLLLDEVDFLLT